MLPKWIHWTKVSCVVVIGFMLPTLIDPYLSLRTPVQIQAANAVLPLILLFLVWGLSGRAWIALLLEVLVLGGLRYADQIKVVYLNTDLVYADFTVLKSFINDPKLIFGFVHFSWYQILALGTLIIGAAAGGWLTRKYRPASWTLRIVCVSVGFAGGIAVAMATAPAEIHSLNWEVYQQARGALRVGVTGNILLGKLTSIDVDHKADPTKEQAFWQEPLVKRFKEIVKSSSSNNRPDIVIVQSESLFMPSQLNGFSDTPVLKRITSKDAGFLEVPVFGGRTLQTEFEVQSGAPIAFFPGSMFAYYELLHHRIDALPHVLDRHGYKTTVIHPNARGFWNRDAAMPALGFATFQDIGSFMHSDYANHGHVSDLSMMRAVLAELDASSEPAYVTAITIDNHGPWGEHAPASDTSLGLPTELTGVARRNMADYVSRAKDADKAFGYLIDALERRKRPTIVAIYGDHLPSLPEVYAQLGFKNGKSPESHMPPYRVWANFPIDTPPNVLPAYLLQGFILRQAGVSMQGHELANAIAGMVITDSAIPDTDRRRILDEYDHIASANLHEVAGNPDPSKDTAFVGHGDALAELQKIGHVTVARGSMSQKDGDMYLTPSAEGFVQVDFNLDHRVASITLRPYSPCVTAEPLTGSGQSIAIRRDGELLYEAPIGPHDIRLLTFNTREVKHLNLTVRGGPGTAKCGIYVRVAQILKCAGKCTKVPAYAVSALARIVGKDPTQDDLKALGGAMSSQVRMTSVRLANMHWLLGHEIARHEGFAPIRLQDDAQLFMHPAKDRDSWIKFDVSGLSSVDLTPRINRLSDECKALSKGGIAALTVSVDGKDVVKKLTIDRDYHKPLHIDLSEAQTMRIDVNKGNDVAWCDWVSVGANNLGFKSVTSEPSAASVDTSTKTVAH